MNANTTQVGGTHYATGAVQHWDFVALSLKGRYFEGNITKYVSRYFKKNGAEDLKKALHYVEKLMELHASGVIQPIRATGDASYPNSMHAFVEQAGLNYWQTQVMIRCALWNTGQDLKEIRGIINLMLQNIKSEQEAWGEIDDESLHAKQPETAVQGLSGHEASEKVVVILNANLNGS